MGRGKNKPIWGKSINIRELTYVALKITGIFSFLWGLYLLRINLGMVPFLSKEDAWSKFYLAVNLIPFVFCMIISFLLLSKTNMVTERLRLPDTRESPDEIRIEGFMSAAFAIIAIVLLVDGFSKLIAVPGIIQTYMQSVDPVTGQRVPMILSRGILHMATLLIKIAMGLYLFFGGDGLIRFWKRYRDKKLLID